MNRPSQYWLLTLLGVTIVCASAAWFLLPFKPPVTFGTPEMAFYSDSNGIGYPDVSVELRNNGRFPVWYKGNDVSVGEFAIEGDLSKGEEHVHSLSDARLSWSRLAPGETVAVPIPTYKLFDSARIHVNLRDWRGLEAIGTSPAFDFSSVSVAGIPDVGVRAPVPIPQK